MSGKRRVDSPLSREREPLPKKKKKFPLEKKTNGGFPRARKKKKEILSPHPGGNREPGVVPYSRRKVWKSRVLDAEKTADVKRSHKKKSPEVLTYAKGKKKKKSPAHDMEKEETWAYTLTTEQVNSRPLYVGRKRLLLREEYLGKFGKKCSKCQHHQRRGQIY